MTTRLHIIVLIIYFNNVIIINMLIKNMLINMNKNENNISLKESN